MDALAANATDIGLAASNDAVRAQAALVRALVDQLGHYHPAERRVAALHAQLGEEVSRLTELLPDPPSCQGPMEAVEGIDVLIVDDEQATSEALAVLVSEIGYPCRATLSAEEALREYERKPAAIVISDWHMPGMSGLDLCRALKHLDPHTYVVLVTAFADEALLLEGVRRGVDDLLPKPIDVDELKTRLDAGAQLVRALRTLERLKRRAHRGPARSTA